MLTHEQALELADRHRAQHGDDVITHYADDYGEYLACPDCGWDVACLDDHYGWDDDDLEPDREASVLSAPNPKETP